MPLVKVSDLHKIAEQKLQLKLEGVFDDSYFIKKASQKLNEGYAKFTSKNVYDIFLSHSYDDALAIYGLKVELEGVGFTVFVDWLEENFADRENVDAGRANELRNQMLSCKCLLFVTSENSTGSVWMPWELGYFDGLKGKVAILPLNEENTDKASFEGQEYLGIYPYVKDYSGYLTLFYHDKRNIRLLNWLK